MKVDIVKNIILDNIDDARCGIYNMRNLVRDNMVTIYKEDGLQVDICYDWAYIEVFGLTEEEFDELKKWYCEIRYSIEVEEDKWINNFCL